MIFSFFIIECDQVTLRVLNCIIEISTPLKLCITPMTHNVKYSIYYNKCPYSNKHPPDLETESTIIKYSNHRPPPPSNFRVTCQVQFSQSILYLKVHLLFKPQPLRLWGIVITRGGRVGGQAVRHSALYY